MVDLKSEQRAFLAECEQEFSERYTLEDPEFNAVYNSDIPPPPIMNNWYPRSKRNQGQGGGRGVRYGGHYRDRRNDRYNNRQEYGRSYDRESSDRFERHSYQENREDSYRDRGSRDSRD